MTGDMQSVDTWAESKVVLLLCLLSLSPSPPWTREKKHQAPQPWWNTLTKSKIWIKRMQIIWHESGILHVGACVSFWKAFANNCKGVKVLCVGLQAAFLGHWGYEGQCYTPSSLTSTLTLEIEHVTSHRARKDVDSRPQWPEAAHVESARVFDLSVWNLECSLWVVVISCIPKWTARW